MNLLSALISLFFVVLPPLELPSGPVFAAESPAYTMPWSSYTEAKKHVVPGSKAYGCGGQALFLEFDNGWAVLASDTRDIFAVIVDGKPVAYIFTETLEDQNHFKVVKVMTKEAYDAENVNDCAYLLGAEA